VEDGGTADAYLDRLGYKPMGGKKANVAIKGVWSNTYNDATVDYANGGFSVMVMNHLKGAANDESNDISIIRLPKEDTMYDYYEFSQTGANDGGTDTNLSDVYSKDRAKNRGRLKTDLLLPTSAQKTETPANVYYGQRTYTRIPIKESELNTMLSGIRDHTETVSAGASNLGYYLVENPFTCGLDMDAFFAANTGLQPRYWLLTATGQHLVQRAATGDWINLSGTSFAANNAVVASGQGFFVQAKTAGQATDITFNKDMQVQSRFGKKDNGTPYTVVIGTQYNESTGEIEDITDVVTIYNYVQDTGDGKVFPLRAPTRGVQTVSTLIQEQAATETHLQIFAMDRTVTVLASTDEPLTSVRCYDTGGRLVHSASPQTATYSFGVPSAGIYVIDAQTGNDRKTLKVTIR
jgi:hypothetical protein